MRSYGQWMKVVTLGFAAVMLLSAGAVGESGSDAGNRQCSLALVTKDVGTKGNICDEKVVRARAKGGQVFEENQLGIASVLAISPDYKVNEAKDWFERAARQGYAPAEVNLAVMYANGWGTAQNYGAALEWLHRAADQHFARAYYNLGVLYLGGKGVPQDYAEALKWFRLGAEAGDSSAETNLGYMYDRGLGVAADVKEAAIWYAKAADAGNPLAQNNLGDMYLHGIGVQQNDLLAFSYFRKAAEQGHTGARIELAYMYAQGRGTRKDMEAAYAWVSAAVVAGDNRGKELMGELQAKLKSDQKKRAESKAKEVLTAVNRQANAFVQ